MKKIELIKVLLFIALILIYQKNDGQNLLNNNSFEKYSSLPNGSAQISKLDNWKDRLTVDGSWQTHSPEFYSDISNYRNHEADPIYGYSGAHYGNCYTGMAPYEILYQGISNLNAGELYYFSAFIQLSDYVGNSFISTFTNGTFTLNVKIATGEFQYQCEPPSSTPFGCHNTSNAICNNDFCTLKQSLLSSNDVKTVLSFPVNLTTYPIGSGWHKIEGVFVAPPDIGVLNAKYNWAGIELTKDNYTGQNSGSTDCQNAYVLIDDVFLGSICNNDCVSNISTISHTAIKNSMVAFDASGDFKIYMQNVQNFEFNVYNTFSSATPIYHYKAFDVNGLKNPGYNDFLFEWLGYLDNGSYWTTDDVFAMTIKMWNCNSSSNFTGTITYITQPPPSGPPQYTPVIQYSLIAPCCPVSSTINNFTYSSDNEVHVQDFIHSGTTSSVTINPGVQVSYHAGNEIELGPYFQSFGLFEAEIAACGFKPGLLTSRIDSITNIKETKLLSKLIQDFSIIPNPSNGVCTLNIPFSIILKEIIVLDMLGNKILIEHPTRSSPVKMDLSALSKGVYVIRAISQNEIYTSKVVLK